jgi:hypothetical protein
MPSLQYGPNVKKKLLASIVAKMPCNRAALKSRLRKFTKPIQRSGFASQGKLIGNPTIITVK